MVKQVSSSRQVPQDTFQFVLPTGWDPITLSDKAGLRAQVHRFVEHHIGGDPNLAGLRRELTSLLQRQAEEATAVGGIVMALGRLGSDNIPLPVSMVCFDYSRVVRIREEDDPATVLAAATQPALRLADLQAPSGTADIRPAEGWVRVEDHPHVTFRKAEISSGEAAADAVGERIGQLQATYLQHVPDFGVVRTVFSTPVMVAQDMWLEVFDAVTSLFTAKRRTSKPEAR
ncbi:MAG: hypothetical protein LBD97_04285 [Bifidobacteriaceae bacterium]|jgi:hypothetical protein|nr:hypothetical protein [Bifidobacteriaceae bacterium]